MLAVCAADSRARSRGRVHALRVYKHACKARTHTMMATQQNARKNEGKQPSGKQPRDKQPRGKPRAQKDVPSRRSARTSPPKPAPPAELSVGSDFSDSEYRSPRERCKTDKQDTAESGRAQFLESPAEMKLLQEQHRNIFQFNSTAFFEQTKTSDAPQEVTQSSAATSLEQKTLQQVDLNYVHYRAENNWTSSVLNALKKRYQATMQELEKLGNIIFRRKSTKHQRRKYFRTFASYLSRGNDKYALDKYIECKNLPDTDWDSGDCELRKHVEALAEAGRNTIPGFFITTVTKDKRV